MLWKLGGDMIRLGFVGSGFRILCKSTLIESIEEGLGVGAKKTEFTALALQSKIERETERKRREGNNSSPSSL